MLKTLLAAIPSTIWWCITVGILILVILHSRGCLKPRQKIIQPNQPRIHRHILKGENLC